MKTIQVQKANEYLEVLEKEKSDAENLLKSANAINQSRRNLEQNIKFLEDKENLHDLGIAFGISGFVLDIWSRASEMAFKILADFRWTFL